MKRVGLFVVLALSLSIFAFAQTYEGRILGSVTDQTGAAVSSAKVTITNIATGLTRTLTTSASGDYAAPALKPGVYSVTAEAPNFKKSERTGVRLEVAKDARIDFQLQPGAVSESVTVTGEAPLVDTTQDTLGGTFSNKAINDLPLNGRDFQNLVVLRPGVQRTPGGGFLSISSNGNRPEDNNFIVDGTDNNDPYYATTVINAEGVQGTPGTLLPIDAIQEFNIQENPTAEYGWKPGSVVNLGIKSGTNDFHGTAYLFERNSALDARNWFNTKPDPQRAVRQHQFGGSIGGPVIKNKTFFFGAYEGIRALVSNSNPIETPSTVTAAGGPDPAVSIPDAIADLNARGIPLSPLSQNLLGTGTFTGNGPFPGLFPVNTSGTNTLTVGFPNNNRMDNGILKFDQTINEHNQASVRYFYGNSLQTEQDIAVVQSQWLSRSDLNAQVLGANWVWTPNSQWVNEAKFGWNRFWQKITTADSNKPPGDFGINTGVTDPANFGMPTIIISNFNNPTLGGNRSWPLFTVPNETYQYADTLAYTAGRHTFRFGGEFRHGSTDNLRDRSGKSRIRFEGGGAFAGSTSLEDFLAGFPSRGDIFVGNSRRTVTINSVGAFLQDDWKITPRVTMNLGLRYDASGVIHEVHNLLGNFDPAVGLQQVGVNIDKPYNTDYNNLAPRLGIAWDMFGTGRTVLRAGGSIIYEIPHLAVFLGQNDTDNATTPGLNVIPTGVNGSNINGNIVSSSVNTTNLNWTTAGPVFNVTPDCAASPCDILGVTKGLRTPYVMTYNVNIQQAFSNSTSLQVAYVANLGRKLYSIRDINQVNPNSPAEIACGNCLQAGRPFATQFPFLEFVNFLENGYNSDYHGLQVTATQRLWNGLSFVAGYTWAHAIDQASLNRSPTPQNSLNLAGERGNSDLDIRHRFTLAFNYLIPGKEGFAQLLKGWQVNSIVTIQTGTPFNVSDGFLNGNDISLTGELTDRWNFFGDPRAFDARHGTSIPFFADGTTVPACAAVGDATTLASFGCFAVPGAVMVPPALGTFGTMGRNIFRGPGLQDWDFSIVKNWQAERLAIQLRAEFFNILNHPNFANPNAAALGFIDPSDPGTFGCACATPDVGGANPVIGTGGQRNIQLGVKFIF
ncbi:MAG: hypothetical protein JWO20_474 [Candidatus Angelobacter sp.]|nr:hypothetical protein [Candidatus Angelobacter sp.]